MRDFAAVDLEDKFVRYRAQATRHADGDVPNLPWKTLLKASCEAKPTVAPIASIVALEC